MSTILTIEDEERVASFIVEGLRAAGFIPTATTSGCEAIQFGLMSDFDFIIPDLGLPDTDGLDVLEELREQGIAASITMLTARSPVAGRVAGLENGADNYMAKPFSYGEPLAGIRLRLKDPTSTSQSSTAVTTPFYGNLTFDYQTR